MINKAFLKSHKYFAENKPLFYFIRTVLYPAVIAVTLLCNFLYYDVDITKVFFLFFFVIVILSVYILDTVYLHRFKKKFPWCLSFIDISLRWIFIMGVTWIIFNQSGFDYLELERVVTIWAVIMPFLLFSVQLIARHLLCSYFKNYFKKRNAVIVGVNEISTELLRLNKMDLYSEINFIGFFENRSKKRVPETNEIPIIGSVDRLLDFVNENDVHVVYIALPMTQEPRVIQLLDSMLDSTASIYFVPNLFVTNLVQARFDHVGGMPVMAICETPFYGFSSIQKRMSDIVISSIICLFLIPIFIVIALAIKLTSKGPILFKQLRYGVDGKEILVYKFRSMTVCENTSDIKQATRNDVRITKLGRFLRKTSLDELPQFINVLQGRMSIVGPRPHAIAHNELYRTIIKGYMVRHKIKPGITGWAQVNGFRGETDTLDKMEQRIQYDLDYLRNWSLGLDLKIMLRTITVVFGDDNAY
jgi:putative colanic acid biosynthesis UDP-glucose lipid carrier transferase